jgi:N-acetylglucosaminyldiphosphoundecaprenol N-acetyl-beta-D-mannosaminyltransferase
MSVLSFAQIQFSSVTAQDILAPREGTMFVVPVNAQVIGLANHDPVLLSAINRFTPVVDGQIVLWAINRRAGSRGLHFDKLSGSDFIHAACKCAGERGLSVALIGGAAASNSAAVNNLRQRYGASVTGYSPPLQSYPFPANWVARIADFLRGTRPDYVFIGFGAPKQELFMSENAALFETLGCQLVVACGGTFDFVSGLRPRAPAWISKAGLEGVYRLLLEPRLFRLRRLWDSVLALRHFRR